MSLQKGTEVIINSGDLLGKKGKIFDVLENGRYAVEVDIGVRPIVPILFGREEIDTPSEQQAKFAAVKAKAHGKGGRKSRKTRGKKRITRKKRTTRRR